MYSALGRTRLTGWAVAATLWLGTGAAQAGVVFGLSGATIAGGSRWDADPRTIGGLERSLDGGLRYSLQGGSYQAFRDMFTWSGAAPSVADFTKAVEDAFNAWTLTDPVTGLPTKLKFVSDFGTAVNTGIVAVPGGSLRLGAEIDIFAFDFGGGGARGDSFFDAVSGPITLTSGTAGYAGFAISGADVRINSNPGAVYTLDLFRRLLTHELGHAIGLGDAEGDLNPGRFIDDNFDGSSSASALATLTNSWALLVDPLNPAASPLSRFTVPFANPGTTTPSVDILMESRGLGIGPTNPLTSLTPLTNDEYGTRQFLYPSLHSAIIPEPGALALFGVGAGGLALCVWRRGVRPLANRRIGPAEQSD
jgi:hypothetical protein